jgi:predicted signal transduction protein with EAL and GGDEF domain
VRPFDKIKIDRGFVNDITSKGGSVPRSGQRRVVTAI